MQSITRLTCNLFILTYIYNPYIMPTLVLIWYYQRKQMYTRTRENKCIPVPEKTNVYQYHRKQMCKFIIYLKYSLISTSNFDSLLVRNLDVNLYECLANIATWCVHGRLHQSDRVSKLATEWLNSERLTCASKASLVHDMQIEWTEAGCICRNATSGRQSTICSIYVAPVLHRKRLIHKNVTEHVI